MSQLLESVLIFFCLAVSWLSVSSRDNPNSERRQKTIDGNRIEPTLQFRNRVGKGPMKKEPEGPRFEPRPCKKYSKIAFVVFVESN